MFTLANASQGREETIFWKQIPSSKGTPFCLLEVLPGPLFCLLIVLLHSPAFVFSSISLTRWWVPLGSRLILLTSPSVLFSVVPGS